MLGGSVWVVPPGCSASVVISSGRDGLGGRAYSQAASPPEWRSALLVEMVGGVRSCMSCLQEVVVFGDDENWGMGFSGRDGLGGRAYSQGASPPEWRSALLVETVGGVRSCMSWLREAVVFGDENSGLCCDDAVCQCTGCRVPWTKWQCCIPQPAPTPHRTYTQCAHHTQLYDQLLTPGPEGWHCGRRWGQAATPTAWGPPARAAGMQHREPACAQA